MGCTIGTKILKAGSEYVAFKNKDFSRDSFDDRLVVEPKVFGARGLHIPVESQKGEDILSGFSIGANAAGICACNSHVRSIEDGENYDLLTEAAVRDTTSVRDACEKVEALASAKLYNRSNIIIVGPMEAAIVEISGETACVSGQTVVVRGNRHLLAHSGEAQPESDIRQQQANILLGAASTVDDVLALCRSHQGEDTAFHICAHGLRGRRNTVYGYVLHWREGELDLYVCRGHPCEHDHVRIPLEFPLDESLLMSVYPTH